MGVREDIVLVDLQFKIEWIRRLIHNPMFALSCHRLLKLCIGCFCAMVGI